MRRITFLYAYPTISFLFLVSACFWVVSAHTADAAINPSPLGSHIVCLVYTDLEENGDPIPELPGFGTCVTPPSPPPAQPPAPPPPPPPATPPTSPPPPPGTPPPPPPSPGAAQCGDGIDNDSDGLIDSADPACHSDGDVSNTSSYDAALDDESLAVAQCKDGLDNDGDGVSDASDSGCHTDFDAGNSVTYDPEGDDESASLHVPQCSDGIDNDGDGDVDTNDAGCADANDDNESDESSGGGGGGGGGGGKKTTVATTTPVVATTTPLYSVEEIAACDTYLTAFIKMGNANDIEQVKRLQRFLNDFEGARLTVSGVYDADTLAGVHTFQTKYAADILAPWGVSESTGFVYLTTRKKVNEIFCNFTKSFPLSEEQLRLIEDVRSRSVPETPAAPAAPAAPAQPAASEAIKDASDAVDAIDATRANVGAVSSVLDFLKGLFGR